MDLVNSLRGKIAFGYAAVGTLIIGLAVFTLVELKVMEAKIRAGEAVADFLDTTLEIRRFEKNLFLYRQDVDRIEQREHLDRAQDLLKSHAGELAELTTADSVDRLQRSFEQYRALMAEYAALFATAADARSPIEARIRAAGKQIVGFAEELSRAERQQLQAFLDRHRRNVVLSIFGLTLLVVAAGQLLSRRVVQPLKEMEERMEEVAGGRRDKLELHSREREIVSLTEAFNHVLEELESRQRYMVRSEKLASLGTMLSGVAHELNNPLSNISTSSQILMEEIDQAERAFLRELAIGIEEQTERARRIVRTLLDFAREREFKLERVPLRVLAEDTVRFLKGQIPTQVSVRIDVADDLAVDGDRNRLQQALLNLVSNALEASIGGSVRIAARRYALADDRASGGGDCFHGRCSDTPTGVDIEVSDQGAGIAPAVMPRIFDPFFTTKDVGKGSGLGLAIVHEIVEEHGGCIAAESREGVGTTFLIRLPQRLSPTGTGTP